MQSVAASFQLAQEAKSVGQTWAWESASWAETPKGVNIYIAAGNVWLTADHAKRSMTFGLRVKPVSRMTT